MVSQDPLEGTKNDVRACLLPAIQPDLNFLHPDYSVLSNLGNGGFGAVFEVICGDHKKLALKVQKWKMTGPSELKREYNVYKRILYAGGYEAIPVGFPVLHEFKEHNGLDYLFMERLGDSLEKIRKRSPGKTLCKSDILMVGIQVVRRLRTLHEKGVLHRDVKPDNLVMGCAPNSEKTVHIIDFGLSSVVQDWIGYDYEEDAAFAGTTYFAPIEALYGEAPSRAGDLESLAYTLLFLFNAKLPWVFRDPETNRELTYDELADQRVEFDAPELCKGFPELTDFVKAVRELQKAFQPEYGRLIALLEAALERVRSRNDGAFSWLQDTRRSSSSSSAQEDCDEEVVEEMQTLGETKEPSLEVIASSVKQVTTRRSCSQEEQSEHLESSQNSREQTQDSQADPQQRQTRPNKVFFLAACILIHGVAIKLATNRS